MTAAQLVSSGNEEGEDGFYKFVRTFACRYESGKFSEEDFARIDFPLPYVSHNTEESNTGVIKKRDFMNVFVGTSQPTICVIDEKAMFSRDISNSGEGYTWYFRLDNGKWHLYKAVIKDY